jgi:chemotaxis protein methyltransferase CheR
MIASDTVEAAVDRVGGWLDEHIGLRPEPTLRGRLRRCILDEAVGHGDDLDAYLRTLAGGSDALQSLINRVTVQESGFFRHPDHFEVLAGQILPALDEPVTIWSAGCANGQEAYSLAMLLEETGIRGSVLATDLSTAALNRTADARYTHRELRGISAERRSRHLVHDGDERRMNTWVRGRVATKRHNLMDELPSQVRGCQVIFCRNVLIYFSAEHATAFLNRLADALAPGAYLFLGAAESLWQSTDRFQAVRMGESFAYRHAEKVVRVPGRSQLPARRSLRVPTRVRPSLDATGPASSVLPPVGGPPTTSQTVALAATGQESLVDGDHAGAVVAFRKWAYLDPEDPMASLHLGLALEAVGDLAMARRAFSVSRAVVLRVGAGDAEAALKGYAAEELLRLLDVKQGLIR